MMDDQFLSLSSHLQQQRAVILQ